MKISCFKVLSFKNPFNFYIAEYIQEILLVYNSITIIMKHIQRQFMEILANMSLMAVCGLDMK